MFELTMILDFAAAHCIPDYPGKCQRLHGHNWKVEVSVEGEKLDKLGMLVDFSVLKRHVTAVLDTLDHHYLNEMEHFQTINPTAENIACYVYEMLEKEFAVLGNIAVSKVTVWESLHSAACYRKIKN